MVNVQIIVVLTIFPLKAYYYVLLCAGDLSALILSRKDRPFTPDHKKSNDRTSKPSSLAAHT